LDGAQEFWNQIFSEHQVEWPDPNDPVLTAALEHFGVDVRNRRLLDLGTGSGQASLFFASRGASVVSVDASEIAISNLRAYCAHQNINNLMPTVLDATKISSIGPFDLVFGSFILHHIEPFDEFATTLRSALQPGGKAFFYENSAMSSLLMWIRKHVVGRLGIPKYGDEEEFPLTPSEIKTLSKYFHTEVVYPELVFFRLISTYLLGRKGQRPLLFLDDLFYRVPLLRRYSYRQYVLLS
jgi:2-polyprenyl-3-methyl-5-hydroxy-6-metoxy-1,4-benzoquinol methylase